jgi:hypothetical protein
MTIIDPTGPLTIGSIPDADIDRMIEATIPDAITTPTTQFLVEQLQGVDPATLTPQDTGALIDLLRAAARPAEDARLAAREAAQDAYDAQADAARLRYANIPAPAGATRVDDWYQFGAPHESWLRYFDCARIGTGRLAVGVGGSQDSDGNVEHTAQVLADDVTLLSAEDARLLAERLTAAAEVLDRLADADKAQRELDAADDAWSAVPIDPPLL